MKQITELTEKEILALTDDQLLNMVKYKMAEDGIKILEKPIVPVYEPLPVKDDIAFSIGGLNFFTKDEKVAKELSALMMKNGDKFLNSSYTTDYNNKFLKEMDEYSIKSFGKIEEVGFYTRDRIGVINGMIAANKKLKEDYEAKLAEYNSANDEADYIRVDIYDRFREVRDKFAKMEELKHQYASYLSLAGGNATIAMNFLKKAYNVSEEAEYYVVGKEMPEIVETTSND